MNLYFVGCQQKPSFGANFNFSTTLGYDFQKLKLLKLKLYSDHIHESKIVILRDALKLLTF